MRKELTRWIMTADGKMISDHSDEYDVYLLGGEEFTDITIYEDDPYEVIRRFLCRGGRGVNGDEPLKWVPLFKMNSSWLRACIDYTPTNYYNKFYQMELEYRIDKKIEEILD